MQRPASREFFQPRIRLTGLLVAAGVVLCGATFLGFLGEFSWFLDLFSNFRVQYLVGLFTLAVLVARWHPRWSACFFALAVSNLATVAPLYVGRETETPVAHPPIRAITLNVNRRFGDVDKVGMLLRDFDPAIVVLEEVSSRWLSELEPFTAGYRFSTTAPREDSFGIAVFSKFPLTDSGVHYVGGAGVPSLIATVNTERGNLVLVATHTTAPSGREDARARNFQLRELAARIRRLEQPVMLLGDLNITPWSSHFASFLEQSGLRNSGKGFGVQPSWPAWMPLFLIPIDHCLHSDRLRVVSRKIGPYVKSDHFPVVVDFTFRGRPPQAGE